MEAILERYAQLVAANPGVLILFRLGDFYEAYDEQAEQIAKTLNLVLTGRRVGSRRVPMVGLPFHSIEKYISTLFANGFKTALIDSEIVTDARGMVLNEEVLECKCGNPVNASGYCTSCEGVARQELREEAGGEA